MSRYNHKELQPGVVSVHLGQAGIQIGQSVWELLCLEHWITPDGRKPNPMKDEKSESFFDTRTTGLRKPRAVFADTDSYAINRLRAGPYKNLFDSHQMLRSGLGGANKIFAGNTGTGAKTVSSLLESIRRQVERCDRFEGFMIYQATGGGTGSGVGSLLLENLVRDYRKSRRVAVSVAPEGQTAQDVYNHVLSIPSLRENADVNFYLENKALNDICSTRLGVAKPTHGNVNQIIAQLMGSLTSGIRRVADSRPVYQDLTEICMSLIPMRDVNFALSSYAPLDRPRVSRTNNEDTLTKSAFDPTSLLAKCNLDTGKYLSICLMYRGNVDMRRLNGSIRPLMRGIKFVEGASLGFKVGINQAPPTEMPDAIFEQKLTKSCAMFCNSSAVAEPLGRTMQQFDALYRRRTSVSNYAAQNVEATDFQEAREGLARLISYYNQCGADEEEEEEEEDEGLRSRM